MLSKLEMESLESLMLSSHEIGVLEITIEKEQFLCERMHLSCRAQKGAGDFIGGMKFCPTDLSKVYVASGDGTLSLRSFERCTSTVLATTQDCSHDYHDVW